MATYRRYSSTAYKIRIRETSTTLYGIFGVCKNVFNDFPVPTCTPYRSFALEEQAQSRAAQAPSVLNIGFGIRETVSGVFCVRHA